MQLFLHFFFQGMIQIKFIKILYASIYNIESVLQKNITGITIFLIAIENHV